MSRDELGKLDPQPLRAQYFLIDSPWPRPLPLIGQPPTPRPHPPSHYSVTSSDPTSHSGAAPPSVLVPHTGATPLLLHAARPSATPYAARPGRSGAAYPYTAWSLGYL